jgi:hypothetical protein
VAVTSVGKVVPRLVLDGVHVKFCVVRAWFHNGRGLCGLAWWIAWQKMQVDETEVDLIAAALSELRSCGVF